MSRSPCWQSRFDAPAGQQRSRHETLGDPTLADASLNRILHNAHRIELKDESLRKRRAAG